MEESTEILTGLLARGEIDLAILPLPVDDPTLETTHILTEPLFLALPPIEQPWMTQAIRRIIRDVRATKSMSTYEREVEFSLETVAERVKPMDGKFTLGVFDDKEVLVGMVIFMRESSLKTGHKGNVFGMYVSPDRRGQGLGKSLMLELVNKARDYDGSEQINLTVVSSNENAKKLYQSVGFKVYGVERNAMKYNGLYFDEDLMVFLLD